MTPPRVKQRLQDRWKILESLYELTGGRASMHSIDIRAVGAGLDLDEDRTFSSFEYLVGEGLAEWIALGGFGTITHAGIREVEAVQNGRQTPHFPASVVIVSGSQHVQIVQGNENSVSMQSNEDDKGVLERLESLLNSLEGHLSPESRSLIEFAAEPESHRFEIAKATSNIVQSNPGWVGAFKEFAQTALTEFGAKFLAEAILFGLRGS